MAATTLQDYLAKCIRRLLVGQDGHPSSLSDGLVATIEDLSLEQFNARPREDGNSIGFEAWHIVRTVDDTGNYALGNRDDAVWVRDGLAAKWDLPERRQGTGMPAEQAHAMRLPEPKVFAGYIREVAADFPPKVAALSAQQLAEEVRLGRDRSLPRGELIGDILVVHIAAHLGQISMLRQLLGKPPIGL